MLGRARGSWVGPRPGSAGWRVSWGHERPHDRSWEEAFLRWFDYDLRQKADGLGIPKDLETRQALQDTVSALVASDLNKMEAKPIAETSHTFIASLVDTHLQALAA